jgi:hypothetical protein
MHIEDAQRDVRAEYLKRRRRAVRVRRGVARFGGARLRRSIASTGSTPLRRSSWVRTLCRLCFDAGCASSPLLGAAMITGGLVVAVRAPDSLQEVHDEA